MFKIGQKLTKENYTEGAVWCNANRAHILSSRAMTMLLWPMASIPEPTVTEQVQQLEQQTGANACS